MFTVLFALSFLIGFGQSSCIYSIYLRNEGSDTLGWSSNGLNLALNRQLVLNRYQGPSYNATVGNSDLILFNYYNANDDTAYLNYVTVEVYGKTILSTLPEASFIRNVCDTGGPCTYHILPSNGRSDSWSRANKGFVFVNGVQVLVLQSVALQTFEIYPKDEIYVMRPYNFGLNMSYLITDDVSGTVYSLSNSAIGPRFTNPTFNLCLTSDWALLFRPLPAVIRPQSPVGISVVLPTGFASAAPIDIKVFFECTGGGGTLWSIFTFSSPNFSLDHPVIPPPTTFGTCEIYVTSQFQGVNPFLPTATQTVLIKYFLKFTEVPAVVSMLNPVITFIKAPVVLSLQTVDVYLSCSSDGWSQMWPNIPTNVQVELIIDKPVPASSTCRLYTLLDPEMNINAEAIIPALVSPFAVAPITQEEIKEFALQAFIPPSNL